MSSFITAGVKKLQNAREWATPTLKDSAFLTRGVLTPEEFVKAGDELVYKCPTWSWESGDEKKRKKYLPADKQYLVTRNVPCPTRVSVLENSVAVGDEDTAHIEDVCGGDDWLVSRMITPEEYQRRIDEKIEEEFDILDYDDQKVAGGAKGKEEGVNSSSMAKMSIGDDETGGGDDGDGEKEQVDSGGDNKGTTVEAAEGDDEYADMEEFEDENVMEDEATAPSASVSDAKSNMNHYEDNIMKVRTYDLSISYDKYYQTPRVWMMGYESADSSQPLSGEQMLQDVMSDYANRTVTIDPHPHVTGYHASIHPCQHGAVMKTIVRNLTKATTTTADGGGNDENANEVRAPSVEMYLFIFLKFVSSIIPTMNYDFTMDVTASTEK